VRSVRLAIILFAFAAIPLFAQPVVGPEVTSAPMDGVGQFALAPQRDGFVIAWEQNGRIHMGRLDSALQLEGDAIQLPIGEAGRNAGSPSVATDGTTALITWHEYVFGQADINVVATVLLDPLTLLQGPTKLDVEPNSPIAAWDGAEYVVNSGGYQYRLTNALDASFGGWFGGMSVAFSKDGRVAGISEEPYWGSELLCIHWSFHSSSGDCTYDISYTLRVQSGDIHTSRRATVKDGTIVPLFPAIAGANGASFAGLFRMPSHTDLLLFDDAVRTSTTLPVTILTDSALAGNGGDVLIVWTGQKQLTGIFVHADRSVSDPFAVSGGPVDEAHVIAAGSSTFVVFYRINLGPNEWRLAGRTIRLKPTKQRSVR
jgi:hypothetical protein